METDGASASPAVASKFSRRDDEAEPVRSAAKPRIQRDEPTTQQPRKRQVFGVVGLRPAELAREPPGRHREPVQSPLDNPELAVEEAAQRLFAQRPGDLAAERQLMEHGRHLAPQERRSDQLVLTQRVPELLADAVKAQLDDEARVADQHPVSATRASAARQRLRSASARRSGSRPSL